MTDSKIQQRKVALLVENLGGGGAEKVTVALANAMAQRGAAVDLLMQEATGPYLRHIGPKVRQIDISEAGGQGPFGVIKFLARYFRAEPPAVFFCHMEKPSLLALIAGAAVGYRKIIPCVHTDLIAYAGLEHGFRRTVLMRLVQIFYRLARSVVAVSEGAAASMRQLLGGTVPVRVIHNGFDFVAMRQAAAADPGHSWLTDKSAPVIVSCGRMVPLKGYDTLLRAFAVLRKTRPLRLLILGEGPERAALTALAQELDVKNDVAMPGFLPNPVACFARADVFVLASRLEALSNVLIEALAVGAPVVCTDSSLGTREIVGHGRFGGLVPKNDPLALAGAIEKALNDPDSLRHPDLEQHLNAYAVDTMVAAYENLLKDS